MSRLTHYPICPFSRSIRLALGELDYEHELVEERPWEWRAAFLAVNPSGELPVLQLSDGAVIAGAYAISEYLGEMVRHAPVEERLGDIFPGTPEDRAEIRRLVQWFHGKLDLDVTRELLKERLYARLQPADQRPQPAPELLRAVRANLRYHLGYMDYLTDNRRWLAGDELSFADFAAAAHMSCLDYLDEIRWEEHGATRRWYQRMKSRPSFRTLLADHVPGVAPPAHYADLDF